MAQHQVERTLDEWLSYLETVHAQVIDMGLERTREVAERLAVLQPAPRVVMVGGTNGKGSTVRMIEEILRAAGLRTATYTSPHILQYRERVRVDGAQLTAEEHCRAFAAVEAARQDITLTYFEFGTLAALWLMREQQVDVAILEVGLGGRLDAVNIVDADVSVVTSIGIDHVSFLGNDREVIGYEKAGIFRSGRPAICGDPEPPLQLLKHAESVGAKLSCVGRDYQSSLEVQGWSFHHADIVLESLPRPKLPLPNAATAVAAVLALGLAPNYELIAQGLRQATMAGRFDIWPGTPTIILDVGHNPHAAKYLALQLADLPYRGRLTAVCGMLGDKDIQGTLAELVPYVDAWYFGTLSGPRAATAFDLAHGIGHSDKAECFDSIEAAFTAARDAAHPDDVILCFGSFYTVAAIYALEGREICG
ncbi:MAG: bifunctional tetrahydrofolate synthase/dihydrofolate synthase [Idiomarina sp.]|nr:bifunctional tetrahydrofolate synthase/dihydrofolate synthase [Idiomarina sp.]